ncbi:mRNA turnover protein 4 homolog [Chenopodium quinoa]|uniref:mRNA turnover protein 4 homolog n=1 Tax=Chenopodium quinoa TaxID=63459 RepID=UPI000B796163|nr:mRNA turnover protein 4 homolog [Chenopodium quinoa]
MNLPSSFSLFFSKHAEIQKKSRSDLVKTKKKGRELKEVISNSIREAAEKFPSVYVFAFENMRNVKFKQFRDSIKSSGRFFLGSNKVMQIALGRSASDEIKSGLHKISKNI